MILKPDDNHIDAVMDGWLEGTDHIYPVMVQFEDTDAGGIVYHANYINFAERARTALLRCMGIDMQDLLIRDEGIVIRKIKIDYIAPSRIGEKLMVITNDFKLAKASVTMTQTICDSRGSGNNGRDQGKPRASLDVQGAFVSGGRPIPIPADVRGKMEAVMMPSPPSQ
jgi:acyl-CoA thioester hydrolase